MTRFAASDVASTAAVQYLQLSTARGVGPILSRRLFERFRSIDAIFRASRSALLEVDGIGHATADEIIKARDASAAMQEIELAAAHNVRILCPEDAEYPTPLRHIPDPPVCLYVRGRLEAEDAVAVAIVGARRCTHYGREQARRFGFGLAERGITVVSGLARGIDGAAHWGAIEAKGRTLAVLGNGLAAIYPPEHRDLAERIVAGQGALLSELPMETPPTYENFVPRNRVIAGLSLGVIVVEAARKSGALSTARHATEYNREVFALPGHIDSVLSDGTNALIRDQHAKLVCHVKDVFDELGEAGRILWEHQGESAAPTPAMNLTPAEQQLLAALDGQGLSIEALCETTGLGAGEVAASLITMQLKGLVRQLPGSRFAKAGGGGRS